MGNLGSETDDAGDIQRCVGNFPDFLRGYGLSYEIINNFITEGIGFEDTPALTDEDLQLLGIKDSVTRKNLLNEFKHSKHSGNYYESYLENLDITEYKEIIYRNSAKQLLAIQNTMTNLNINLQARPFLDNIIVDDVYVSSLITKALEEIRRQSRRVSQTKKDKAISYKVTKLICNWKTMAVLSGAATLVFAFKLIRN